MGRGAASVVPAPVQDNLQYHCPVLGFPCKGVRMGAKTGLLHLFCGCVVAKSWMWAVPGSTSEKAEH